MKLYGSLTSPYVRKLRIFIIEKLLPVEFVAVESAADPNIAARNPLGKVPVLERDDGFMLFDSPVIAEYLDSLAPPELIPPAGEARWQVLRWAALGDGVMDAVAARLMESRRPAPQQSVDVMRHQEGKVRRAMDFAEREIVDAAWLVENQYSLADVALATALEYVDFRYPHAWRDTHPKLAAWQTKASARPSFYETRPPTPK